MIWLTLAMSRPWKYVYVLPIVRNFSPNEWRRISLTDEGEDDKRLPAHPVRDGPGEEDIEEGGAVVQPAQDQLNVVHLALNCAQLVL